MYIFRSLFSAYAGNLDVAFIIDNSILNSATGSWELRRAIMSYLVESLPVAQYQDNVAAVLYNNRAQLRFRLNEYFDETFIRQLIENFPTSGAVS